MTAKKLRIAGKVQGVWYRAWTKEQADRLGLFGYVRNLVDGSVEAVFVGEEERVLEMISLCWQGPEFAQVESVQDEVVLLDQSEYSSFDVIR